MKTNDTIIKETLKGFLDENIMIKIPTEVIFRKKKGGILKVQATKVISLKHLLKKKIRKALRLKQADILKEIDKIKLLLPKTATESERILMNQFVNIYKRKLRQRITGK